MQLVRFGKIFVVGLLVAMPSVQVFGIVYVPDEGFSLPEWSGSREAIQMGGSDEDLIFRDWLSTPLSHGWWIAPTYEPGNRPYAVAGDQDVSSDVENLPLGFKIDEDLTWAALSGGRSSKRIADYERETGNFFDTEGFLGIRIFAEGEEELPSYGWIRAEHSLDQGEFTVHDWAWNSTPGEPILAGEIPEPKVYALVLGIGVLVWAAVRRRWRRSPVGSGK